MKFLQVDIMVGIAALDIVTNQAPHNPAFDYTIAEPLLVKLQSRVKSHYIRLSLPEARLILQAMRLAVRHVGDIRMDIQAMATVDRLERFCNDN